MEAGHNSGVEAGHLRAFLERIERLEEEKRAISDDIREVYSEAKGSGYDPKIMRKIVSLRRMDRQKRIEEEEMLSLYLEALGDFVETPLGDAAVTAAKRFHESLKRDGLTATISTPGHAPVTLGAKA